MPITATAVLEIRANGNALNGGFFDPATPNAGTDYSQQNTAQLSLADIATDGAGTTLTSATGGFTAAMIGNAIWLTGGGATANPYVIRACADTNTVTIHESAGASKTGVSGKVGGAQVITSTAPNKITAAGAHLAADGTHTLTANATIGPGTPGVAAPLWGYGTVRGDEPTGDNRPLVAGGAYRLTLSASAEVYRVRMTGGGANGFLTEDYSLCFACKFTRSSGSPRAFFTQAIYNHGCTFVGCFADVSTGGDGWWLNTAGCCCLGCVVKAPLAEANTYRLTAGTACVDCVCIGGSGFIIVANALVINCTSYAAVTGVYQVGTTHGLVANSVMKGCTTGDDLASAGGNRARRVANNLYGNTTARNNTPAGFLDIAVDPQFVDAPGGNFYPGANLRARGFPGAFGDGINTGHKDIGAVQRSEFGASVGFTGDITYHLLADFGKTPYLDTGRTGINAPAGYESEIPPLVVGDSFELILDCWEDYAASGGTRADFGSGAGATLYLKRLNSAENPITLATTTPETDGLGTEFNRVRFVVPAAAITSVYANQRCLIYAVVTGTQDQRTLLQEVDVISPDGTGAADLETKNVPVSMDPLTTSQTLTAYPGYVCYHASGTISLTLPAAAAYTQQEIVIVNTGSGVITVVGTINGDAGGLTLSRRYDTCRLLSDGSAWYNANLTTIVR